MKLLITGANGLVGSHFIENYQKNSNQQIFFPDRDELDITNQKSVEDFIREHRPEMIIHFAAFTDVSEAEQERDNKSAPCWVINVEGTANLIKALKYKTYFIYISTDAVFSGHKDNPGPYSEDYPTEENPNMLSWYGWTKRQAEKIVTDNLKNAAILRIANPVRAKYDAKLDYVRKILKLFDSGELYPLFNNQYLTLTYIDEVTEALKILLEKKFPGIYHVSSTNIFTPYDLANFLIEKARGKKNIVKPASITKFLEENIARYPQYGGLKVENTQQKLGLKFMRWQDIIESIVKQFSTLG